MAPVLALDLATVSGFAFWRPGMARPRYGCIELPKKLQDHELHRERASLRRWMTDWDKLEPLKGGYVVIEAAWVRFGDPDAVDPEDRRRDSLRQVEHLFGLATEAATTAHMLRAEPRDTNHAKMMKAWTGRGDYKREPGKEASILAACALGWDTDDHNEADALGLLYHFTQLHRFDVPWRDALLFGGKRMKVVGGA